MLSILFCQQSLLPSPSLSSVALQTIHMSRGSARGGCSSNRAGPRSTRPRRSTRAGNKLSRQDDNKLALSCATLIYSYLKYPLFELYSYKLKPNKQNIDKDFFVRKKSFVLYRSFICRVLGIQDAKSLCYVRLG